MAITKKVKSDGYVKRAIAYANNIVKSKKPQCNETVLACRRFLNDLKRNDLDFKVDALRFVIEFIEHVVCHKQGESINGEELTNETVKLQEWQIFIVVNLLLFYKKNTLIRRYNECLIMIPRKQGKTTFASSLGLALAILNRMSGSKLYILANSLKQARESFDFLLYNVNLWDDSSIRIRDNNQEHSLQWTSEDDGNWEIYALANKEDNLDSFNSNLLILDEVHTWKNSKKYTLMKNSQKAYRNKLLIAISTAGDKPTGFLAQRLDYCRKVLNETIEDDSYFIYVCKANETEDGTVSDYVNEDILRMSNPSVDVTVSLTELMNDARQAMNDPQLRGEFFNKTLNIFTASNKAYFDIEEFRASDNQYDWSIEDLLKMNLKWFGGADLSRMHDLTATALYSKVKVNGVDVDICITHAFFPKIRAHEKAEQDGIPLFGWQEDGHLTMCKTPTVNPDDPINWFLKMKKMGFKIKQVGFDRKFGREFVSGMKKAGFRMIDQPQNYWIKSEGFRRIEYKVKNKQFYYLHSDAYEYCVQNVLAIEKVDDLIQYEKVDGHSGTQRIDLFDASVFSCIQMLQDSERAERTKKFLLSE